MALIDIDWKPSRTMLRRFAAIWFPALCALVALSLWRKLGAHEAAAAVLGGGLVLGAIGFFVPAVIRPIFIGLSLVTFPIGFVVSHLLLATIYYLVITPMGLVMRAVGHDPMRRKFDRSATTYLVERKPEPDENRYFRQY